MEINKDILQNALNKLPAYEPDEKIWLDIKAKLSESNLHEAISALKQYEPNEQIWSQIVAELKPKQTKIISFKSWKLVVIAASIVCMLGISWLYMFDNQYITKISYSTEKINKELILNKNDDAEKQYQQIKAFCKDQTYVCENPEFRSLKVELDELTIASQQLKNAIGDYNTEPELIAQFTQIEQQRVDIVRKMVEKI